MRVLSSKYPIIGTEHITKKNESQNVLHMTFFLNFKHLEELNPIGQRIDKTVDGFLLLVLYDMILDFSCQ
jgi:hypothetical protein